MNTSNIVIIISTLLIAAIFLGGVFLNLEIKTSKEELADYVKQIELIKKDIKRQKIEITTLTTPENVLEYIDKYNLKPVKLKNVKYLEIKEAKK